MEAVYDYESMVVDMFKDDPELGKEMVISGIEYYHESGADKDTALILLNLKRIIKVSGYGVFDSLNLSEFDINNAIRDKENYDPKIINKMIEALGIEERI